MDSIFNLLQAEIGLGIQQNVLLAPFTTYKIGGLAKFFYQAQTNTDLVKAIIAARKYGIQIFVLGGGTNILVSDQGFAGLVIKNNAHTIAMRGMKGKITRGTSEGKVFVEADSGVIFNQLVRFSIEEGLGGLEMHLGLPGTVGGAIYMNSKWMKSSSFVGDSVYQATILTNNNQIKTVPQSYFRFKYDFSILQETQETLLSVVFALQPSDKNQLWETANNSISYRRQSQPQGVFTAGCTFRNISRADALTKATPNGSTSAGFLIDHAGLKGMILGNAQISPVHANFIVNLGQAKSADVIKLIEKAKFEVKRQFGIDLKEEIVKIGNF
jgi:UDP-N-acetylenolpyruvoylglucosamine reductase